MQSAEVILSILGQKSRENPHYVFRRLYRYLFQPEFCLYVQQKASLQIESSDLDQLIQQLRSERYDPSEKNEGQDVDQLVQEMLYLLLLTIYQPLLVQIRQPKRKIPELLTRIELAAKNCHWVFGAKIKTLSSRFPIAFLFQTMREKIEDGRLLELIRRFLLVFQKQGDQGEKKEATKLFLLLKDLCLLSLDRFIEQLNQELLPNSQVNYVRWGEEFLIFVKGTKRIAKQMRDKIAFFLGQNGFRLEEEKLTVRSLREKGILFMNYQLIQSSKGKLLFLIPHQIIQQRLSPFLKNGKSTHHRRRIHLPVQEMIKQYNDEISGLYHYYRFAHDVKKKLGKFRYYHFGSLLKTIARKEQCSVKQVLRKYGVRPMQKGKATIQMNYIDANRREKKISYFMKPFKRTTDLIGS